MPYVYLVNGQRAPAEPPAPRVPRRPTLLLRALRWPFAPLAWVLLGLGIVFMAIGEAALILSILAKSVHDGIPRRLEDLEA